MNDYLRNSNGRSASSDDQSWRGNVERFSELVSVGMQRAVDNAIAEHHRAGQPVVIWRDGGIVWLYPDGSTRPHVPGEEPPK